jgi:hypothetical protein
VGDVETEGPSVALLCRPPFELTVLGAEEVDGAGDTVGDVAFVSFMVIIVGAVVFVSFIIVDVGMTVVFVMLGGMDGAADNDGALLELGAILGIVEFVSFIMSSIDGTMVIFVMLGAMEGDAESDGAALTLGCKLGG